MAMGYVVIAEFRVEHGQIEAFRSFMQRHAKLSRAEPGCSMFEVCQVVADPAHFVFHEVFDDEAAYLAHRDTAHYQLWRDAAPRMAIPHRGELFMRRSILRQVT